MHVTFPNLHFDFGVSRSLEPWKLTTDRLQAFAPAPRETAGPVGLHAAGRLEGFMSDSWAQCWDPLRPSVWPTQSLLPLAPHSQQCFSVLWRGIPVTGLYTLVLTDITNKGLTQILLTTMPQFDYFFYCYGNFRVNYCNIATKDDDGDMIVFFSSRGKDNWGTFTFHSTQKWQFFEHYNVICNVSV